ncbi:hypothetical protein C0Q70_02238 [Pomacea canaliculata]|uniref:Uncharacterized protein n=1 Tax=Pomacea canaliculata TaxID=400727 RepID=A0A2T7Q1R3_POMCA|nr:hypothetical protein C0Q70_02238 [Pomacea canaliculata]
MLRQSREWAIVRVEGYWGARELTLAHVTCSLFRRVVPLGGHMTVGVQHCRHLNYMLLLACSLRPPVLPHHPGWSPVQKASVTTYSTRLMHRSPVTFPCLMVRGKISGCASQAESGSGLSARDIARRVDNYR